ncbi:MULTISPECIES: hypothetical protein [unclassified Paenibacillus]|uniref:hypothetical protein n=1 Tax=unclassified Paenibacillus TaxID=185978 RepID=UPI001AE54B8C|nr:MULTISPECIES: hypothetical protein [unclassified Paenibacillus]MBP1153911.1 hypothetical protein [Paenibacillus sp. PvP091]MBP1170704.1 hypothetical protein [Paenibacillus sp. PvR098]MBP2441732.1 hypothetical protein [Paenibacillus sp. PvP052]
MTVKHKIKCNGSEVLVREAEDKTYQLSIQATNNPLGFGNVLETFSDIETAIKGAELFCKLLAEKKEDGYHLENDEFVKADCENIPVAGFLRERM